MEINWQLSVQSTRGLYMRTSNLPTYRLWPIRYFIYAVKDLKVLGLLYARMRKIKNSGIFYNKKFFNGFNFEFMPR